MEDDEDNLHHDNCRHLASSTSDPDPGPDCRLPRRPLGQVSTCPASLVDSDVNSPAGGVRGGEGEVGATEQQQHGTGQAQQTTQL